MNFKNLVIHRFSEFQTLFVWSCATFLLLLFRIKLSGSFHFLFLVWNLFLAFVPYGITLLFQIRPIFYVNKLLRWSLILLWLLFLPNAPYIVTDFVHLYFASPVQWFLDFVTIGSFAALALLMGWYSLRDMQQLLSLQFNKKWVTFFLWMFSFLSGFGVYIGRITRLNSWDAFFRPKLTLEILVESTQQPFAWVMTLGFGLMLLIGKSLIPLKN